MGHYRGALTAMRLSTSGEHLVETELVALDVLHQESRLVDAVGS